MKTNIESNTGMRDHATKIREQFEDIISHLREDITKLDDPREKALFEVSAEVITGLQKAFTDFEAGKEEAWKA